MGRGEVVRGSLVFTLARAHPTLDKIEITGPGKRYSVNKSELGIYEDSTGLWIAIRGKKLSRCSEVMKKLLLDLGIRMTGNDKPKPIGNTRHKWKPRQLFFLDWQQSEDQHEQREVYGDILGPYGIPKMWRNDVGGSSMRISTRDRNLTHLGTGLTVTKRIVKISDMKRLGGILVDNVPDVPSDRLPPPSVLADMKRIVQEFVDSLDDDSKYEE